MRRVFLLVAYSWQFFVTFLGWLSDLQIGDEKVTLNHLVDVFCLCWTFDFGYFYTSNLLLDTYRRKSKLGAWHILGSALAIYLQRPQNIWAMTKTLVRFKGI